MIHRKYDTSEIWYIDKPATYCIDESSQFSPDRINCLVHIICNKRASQFVGEREKATCSPIFRVPVLEAGFRLSPAVERPHWTSRKISSALWGWGGGGIFYTNDECKHWRQQSANSGEIVPFVALYALLPIRLLYELLYRWADFVLFIPCLCVYMHFCLCVYITWIGYKSPAVVI